LLRGWCRAEAGVPSPPTPAQTIRARSVRRSQPRSASDLPKHATEWRWARSRTSACGRRVSFCSPFRVETPGRRKGRVRKAPTAVSTADLDGKQSSGAGTVTPERLPMVTSGIRTTVLTGGFDCSAMRAISGAVPTSAMSVSEWGDDVRSHVWPLESRPSEKPPIAADPGGSVQM
jgi:hypothetical protein